MEDERKAENDWKGAGGQFPSLEKVPRAIVSGELDCWSSGEAKATLFCINKK